MNRLRIGMAMVWLALLLVATPALAEERIVDYHSDIQIAADGSMTVAEHIRVVAEGNAIKRGIYRDFPTDYRDRQHNRYQVGFDVLDASLDDAPVAWRSERRANGVRVYLGDKDQLVSHGEHSYTIHYRTTRQLGFFAGHDELYWNVTGTGWAFPIARASATVRLPVNVAINQLHASGYTGDEGSQAHDLDVRLLADGASFETNQPLGPHQNLSVVLEFPKGIVAEPATQQKLVWLLQDNRNLLLAVLGLFLLWLYYGWAWNRFGRDPASGPLVARYEPPNGDSAAALRYVREMGYDNTCFTAGVLGLASRGRIEIEQDDDNVYTLIKSDKAPDDKLPLDASKLLAALFAVDNRVVLTNANHRVMAASRKAHQKALSLAYEKKYFLTNSRKLVPGLLISVAVLLAMLGGAEPAAWFVLFWLSFWTLGVFVLLSAAISAMRGKGMRGVFRSIGIWLFSIPFLAGEVFGLVAFGHLAGYAILPVFVALLGTNFAFYHWMKAPTQDGARLLDGINGFRWYLGVAEKQELDSRYRPEAKPELFAQYLPYAVALDAGNAWSERFAQALTPAQLREAQPNWYHGAAIGAVNASSFSSFANGLSAGVSGAIASSSVAPGSSSGGGGGSSGGGGGGGGGGGW
ncbi:MAG TPA: DUF2207 domain-containing protein [Rhodanobacter sp.]